MKTRLMHNLGLKILSVVVAALLWLTIMNLADPVVTDTISKVPITICNDEVITSRGYQYSVESGETVDLRVKGKRSVVDQLTAYDFSIKADFNSLNSMYMVPLTVECLSESAQELVVTLRTEAMAVKLEDQETQPYSVSVVLNGQVKEGYYCYESKLSSSLIQVTGSKTSMDALKDITATVDVDGKNSSFTAICGLIAYDAAGNEIDLQKLSFSQDSVEVTVGICPTKTVPVEVVPTNEAADGYYVDSIEFAPKMITVAAEDELLRSITSVQVPLDVHGAEGNVDIQANLSDIIQEEYEGQCFTAQDNACVSIVATVKPVSQRLLTLTEDDISAANLAEGLECTIYSMWDSSVVVKGPETVIAGLEISDLNLYVDVNGCSAGTYSRQVKSDFGNQVTVEAGSVMLRLTEKSGD